MNKRQWGAASAVFLIFAVICGYFAHVWGSLCITATKDALTYAAIEDAMYTALAYIFFAGALICGLFWFSEKR